MNARELRKYCNSTKCRQCNYMQWCVENLDYGVDVASISEVENALKFRPLYKGVYKRSGQKYKYK